MDREDLREGTGGDKEVFTLIEVAERGFRGMLMVLVKF